MREPPLAIDYDGVLGRQIIELHVWAVRQGLLGVDAAELFDGFCRRLVHAQVPLWRASAAMRTLHPQWGGYSYTWHCDLNAIEPSQFERDNQNRRDWLTSPFAYLIAQAQAQGSGEDGNPWLHLRRRLAGPEAQLDFPILEELAACGATDYFAQIVRFGPEGDASRGTGIAYSFATQYREGFAEDNLLLLRAVLPALSLAMMTHAGHTIASSLLEAYLGGDAGRRVHAGAIERGSVESIRAVLWFADMRGFTKLADTTPGLEVIELLDEMLETLTAPLRSRGGEVLKFMGDGMLAIFPLLRETQTDACRRALDAAREAIRTMEKVNRLRSDAGKPVANVDLALHIGEVLYGNVGASDRLDFTVIGPAVNEAARIETLCEPLGRNVLVSAEFADATGSFEGLQFLGHHRLRGVREPRAIYGLEL
ncbi:MAG: adenylate/guanylate cyclase domain-containing protein [Alphaproteobacteria bacterium]|nr:adenylate/guanylate cyclase domain-containing protein [Alphaproteobacteria bacterium]MBV9373962.1 adenylate/guanylate cyclase domain-containing protein [Alphaproteobacteria bacterium]